MDIIEGISYHELYILQRLLVSNVSDGFRVVEIGSWKGCSSYFLAHILNHFKDCHLYCIDMWKGNYGTWQIEEVNTHNIKDVFDSNIREFNHIITTIKEDSKTAHSHFENNSIDFIFDDGDHTYYGLLSDLKNYYPKLKKGGIICGHDSNARFETLSPIAQNEVDDNLDTDCIYIKSLDKRVHCGVTRALYDMFGDSYYRSGEGTSPFRAAEEGVKNSLWWKIKE
jgi:predicted O-methyltransferase YrrM